MVGTTLAITTKGCKTAVQLFTTGSVAQGILQNATAYRNIDMPSDASRVIMPEVNSPLTPVQVTELKRLVNPLYIMLLNYNYEQVQQFVLDKTGYSIFML